MHRTTSRALVTFLSLALIAGVGSTTPASGDIIREGSVGRFVRVENVGPIANELAIAELEVFSFGYTPPAGLDGSANNLALPAQGASFESKVGSFGHGTDAAVFNNVQETDGATFNLNTAAGNSYTLDLGQNRDVGLVKLWQRNSACCQDRLAGVSVSLLADNGAGLPGAQVATQSLGSRVPNRSFETFDLADNRLIRPGGDGAIGTENVNGATGRFIRVTNNGVDSRRLHIGEIEAFLSGDTVPAGSIGNGQGFFGGYVSPDVAAESLGASFESQVGTIGHGSNRAPFDIQGQSGADTYSLNPGVGNSYTMDLGQDRNLGTIRVWNRRDCCGDRLSNFTVDFLADNGAGLPGATVFSQSFPGQPAQNSFASFSTLVDDFTIRGIDTLEIDINAATTAADLLSVGGGGAGDLVIQTGATLDVSNLSGSFFSGQTFDILDFGTVSGEFSNVILPAGRWDLSNLYVTGQIAFVTIPEPSTVLLVGFGLAGLAMTRRRRRHNVSAQNTSTIGKGKTMSRTLVITGLLVTAICFGSVDSASAVTFTLVDEEFTGGAAPATTPFVSWADDDGPGFESYGPGGAAVRDVYDNYDHDQNGGTPNITIPGAIEVNDDSGNVTLTATVTLPGNIDTAEDGILTFFVANRANNTNAGDLTVRNQANAVIFGPTDNTFNAADDNEWILNTRSIDLSSTNGGETITLNWFSDVNSGGNGLQLLDIQFDVQLVPAPEPSTLVLAMFGLMGLGLRRRRRRRA